MDETDDTICPRCKTETLILDNDANAMEFGPFAHFKCTNTGCQYSEVTMPHEHRIVRQ